MSKYILMLVLLIAIACGIFYICIQKIKEPLDTYFNECPRGCIRATSITGNCKPYKKIKNQMVYDCPSECRNPNVNRQKGICSYDSDCTSCKTSLIYSNGRPYRPSPHSRRRGRGHRGRGRDDRRHHGRGRDDRRHHGRDRPGISYPICTIPPSLILSSTDGLPANIMNGGKKNLGASSLYPGSTIIIYNQ